MLIIYIGISLLIASLVIAPIYYFRNKYICFDFTKYKVLPGLGNQMFMCAATYAIAKNNNAIPLIICNLSAEQIDNPIDRKQSIHPYATIQASNKPPFFLSTIDETRVFSKISSSAQLTGNFESHLYFKGHEDAIKRMFTFPKSNHVVGDVCIHVRLGDFVNTPYLIPVQYYYKAMKLMQSMVPNCSFFIISDDMEMAKSLFSQYDVQFVNINSAIETLSLMIQCKYFIISNSTFSWWGAYLSKSEIVIAPSPRYTEEWCKSCDMEKAFLFGKISHSAYPKEWIQLDYRDNLLFDGEMTPLFQRPFKATVVTAYYNIIGKNPSQNYTKWGSNFLQMPFNLVLYTDKRNKKWIQELRGNLPMILVEREFKDLYHYKYHDKYVESYKMDYYKSHSPDLFVIWAEKVKFVMDAITYNDYQSDVFMWVDFGSIRSKHIIKKSFPTLTKYVPKHMMFNMVKNKRASSTGKKIPDTITPAGNCIVGDVYAWNIYNQLWDKNLQELISKNSYIGSDEEVMMYIIQDPSLPQRHVYPTVDFMDSIWWYYLYFYSNEN